MMKTEQFLVPGVSCQHCVHAVTSEVSKLAGVQQERTISDAFDQTTTNTLVEGDEARVRQAFRNMAAIAACSGGVTSSSSPV